jgi:hypothetical protein
MTSPSLRALAFALLALAALPARAARAGEPDEATRLFDKGMELMNAGQFGAACPSIERSQTLDPRPGTLFTLAECEAKRGRIARAYARYDEYLALFEGLPADRKAKQGDRPRVAREQRFALAKRVPTLKIVLPARVPRGMVVARDEVRFDPNLGGFAVPVEPGTHSVSASAPGMKPWTQSIDVPEGASIVLVVPALDTPPAVPGDLGPLAPAAPAAPEEAPRPTQRIVGGVLGGAGIAGVIVASVLGVMAKSRWKSALDAGHCLPDGTGCDPVAKGRVDDATSAAGRLADGSTAGFVVGGAALVAGIVTFATAPAAPREAATWRLVPARSGAGAALEVTF